jgi:DNA replication protein DnaC
MAGFTKETPQDLANSAQRQTPASAWRIRMKLFCTQCSKKFEREVPPECEGLPVFKVCQTCINANAAERQAETVKRLAASGVARWLEYCPPAFQDTDLAKLPYPKVSAQVLAWEYQSRGMLLYGKTRSGKTRTAWLLIKKQFEAGRTARVMDSMSGFEYAAIFGAGGAAALEWVQARCRCSLLFLDDVFKVKLTESFEAAMFAIVDHRLNYNLPVIATLNDTGSTLSARMTGDRGEAFIARLREMSDTIHFKCGQPKI